LASPAFARDRRMNAESGLPLMSSNISAAPVQFSDAGSTAETIASSPLNPSVGSLFRQRPFRLNPYWLAVLSALFGFVLRLTIDPWLGNQMPYITFLVAVALVGLFAEAGPALVSAGLGAVIAYWCFVPPRYELGFQGVSDAAGFFSYLAAALGIVLLTGARKTRTRKRNGACRSNSRQRASCATCKRVPAIHG